MPSTVPKRPLHRGTCIEDLMRESEVKLETKNPERVCKTLGKMLEEGRKHRINRDDESAYIVYMRFIFCIKWLRKTPEFLRNKDFLRPYVTGTKVKEILDLLEEMSKNLIDRYEAKKLEESAQRLTDNVEKMQIDTENTNLDDLLDEIGDVRLNLPDTPTDDPAKKEAETSITCMETFQAMQKLDERMIIIDIREREDFQNSHILSDRCINIPANLIKSGQLARIIFESLPKEKRTQEIIRHRAKQYTDLIVLLDWQTTKDSLNPGDRLHVLKSILWDWDPGVKYEKIVVLDGGYKEWLTRYPTFTTNPSVDVPDVETNNVAEILEEVEYPDSILSDEEQPLSGMNLMRIPARSLKPTTKEKKDLVAKKFNASNNRKSNDVKSLYYTNQTNIYPNNLIAPSNGRTDIDKTFVDNTVATNKVAEISNFNDTKFGNDRMSRNLISKPKEDDVAKPLIDRSSKPNPVKTYDPDSEKILSLLKEAKEVLKSQVKLANEKMLLESQAFGSEDQKNGSSEQITETKKLIEALSATIQKRSDQYLIIKTQLNVYKLSGIKVDSAHEKEKAQLELDIGLAEHEVQSVAIKRKLFISKRDKKLEENMELKRRDMSSPPHQVEKDIQKTPLKKDGPSPNSGLKRSYSSPNLAQLDTRKESSGRGLDNKIPQVDRTSKPLKQQQQNINNIANNAIVNRQPLRRDREQRMNPVFGNMHPGITGLKNLGNSCYMNSIIQCLSNTTSLARYFIQGAYTDDLNTKNRKTEGQVVEEVAQVIKALWCGHYRSISPRDLKVVIGQYKLQFENYEQQDSHEFLTFLLDWMHSDLKTKAKPELDRSISNAEKEWDKAMGGHTSIISQLFFGQLRSTISCATCGNSSTTYECFNSLTLSLPDAIRCTLDDCIRKYVSGQRVSGWRCPSCKAARDATKKFDFVKLAPIIVVHLNRFGETGGWIQKTNTAVEFPLDSLDLRSYVAHEPGSTTNSNNSYQQTYNLYAVSNHYGTMEGGHYTAYCNSASQNKWYKYDDHTVREVPPSEVRSQTASAYLLFYTSVPNSPFMVM